MSEPNRVPESILCDCLPSYDECECLSPVEIVRWGGAGEAGAGPGGGRIRWESVQCQAAQAAVAVKLYSEYWHKASGSGSRAPGWKCWAG